MTVRNATTARRGAESDGPANGDGAAAVAANEGSQTASGSGPATAVEALQAFRETQERRVAHWKEYEEALGIYERTNLNARAEADRSGANDSDSSEWSRAALNGRTPQKNGTEHGETAEGASASSAAIAAAAARGAAGHRCGAPPSSASEDVGDGSAASGGGVGDGDGGNHYHSVELPMTDEIFNKVLSLVTSGLLDCSHAVRTVETELRTALGRPDLARLVGRVQDLENAVLRSVVERDQTKRRAKVEGRDLSTEDMLRLDAAIRENRAEIQETMGDIGAEMAELQYGSE